MTEDNPAAEPPLLNSGRSVDGKFAKGNRHRFPRGQSGNPAGRPKAVTLSEAYRRQLAREIPGDAEGRTFAEVIAFRDVMEAAKGELDHAREVSDRTEGKPRMSGDFNLNLTDWREVARAHGVTEEEAVESAHEIIREWRADQRRAARRRSEACEGED